MKKKKIIMTIFSIVIILGITVSSAKILKVKSYKNTKEISIENQAANIKSESSSHEETNEPKPYEEKNLVESNMGVPYTLDQSKNNNDFISITNEKRFLNTEALDDFLEDVKNKKPSKIRYTQYYGEKLDAMRDIDFDGNKFIIKDYDTKSPEKSKYFYLTFEGNSLKEERGYYLLENNNIKLFPVVNK